MMKKFMILLLPIACFSLLTFATGCDNSKEKQGQEHFGPSPGDGKDCAPSPKE